MSQFALSYQWKTYLTILRQKLFISTAFSTFARFLKGFETIKSSYFIPILRGE